MSAPTTFNLLPLISKRLHPSADGVVMFCQQSFQNLSAANKLARQAVRRLPLPLSAIPRGGPPFPTNLSMPIGGDLLCI